MNSSMGLKIKEILQEIKERSFSSEYQDQATDEQCMGLLISKYFEFEGVAILETASYALQDANFHEESKVVKEMVDKYLID